MLQAAIAFFNRVEHEHIALVGSTGSGFFVVPKLDFGFANFLRIGQQTGPIEGGQGARHHKFMGNAASRKLTAPKIAQLKRTVDQLIVVGCHIIAKALFVDFAGLQTCGHLPCTAFDGCQCDGMGQLFLTMHSQTQTGAIEEAALSVEPCSAHRIVEGIHLITQVQGLAFFALKVPLTFVVLVCCNCFAALRGL